jgi:hypothetical protein
MIMQAEIRMFSGDGIAWMESYCLVDKKFQFAG